MDYAVLYMDPMRLCVETRGLLDMQKRRKLLVVWIKIKLPIANMIVGIILDPGVHVMTNPGVRIIQAQGVYITFA